MYVGYVCVVHSVHLFTSVPSVNVNVCKCSYIINRLNYAASSCVVYRVRGKFIVQYLTLQMVCNIA